MSEKKLLPKLRFVDENDEWDSFKLGDVLDKKGYIRGPFGSALKRGEMKTEGIPVYEQQHAIYDNRLFRYYIDDNKFEELKRFQVIPDDLIVSCSGTIGKTSLIRENDEKGIISQALLILRSNSKIIEPKFLKYFLETNKGYNSLISSAGGSSQVNIAKKQIILDIPLVVPKLQTQHKIINFLDKISYKIELLEHKYEKYQDFKKYLMQQIFAQKLRFDYTDEWKNIPFKKLLKEINEKTTVNNQYEILSSTKEGIFTQKEYFADRNVASKDNTGYKILRKNQIVLSPQNLWMGNINVNTEFDIGIVSPSYKIYETTDLVYINYFKHIIKLPRLIYEYTCASEQGASIVRRNLNKELFNEITIKVPAPNEQEKIGKLFDAYDEKIKNIDKNIQDMKEFKKGLLQQMFV